jgi:hypothetical protein
LLQQRRARDTIFIVQGAIDEVFGCQCPAKQVFKTMDAEHPGLSEFVGPHFPAIDHTLPELGAEPIITPISEVFAPHLRQSKQRIDPPPGNFRFMSLSHTSRALNAMLVARAANGVLAASEGLSCGLLLKLKDSRALTVEIDGKSAFDSAKNRS